MASEISLIKDSLLFNNQNFKHISDIFQELNEITKSAQICRTKTEMETSILNDVDYPTPDAKYWQVIREVRGMFYNLVGMSFSYRKEDIKLKRLQRGLNVAKDPLDIEEIRIQMDESELNLRMQKETAMSILEEIDNWLEIKDNLAADLKFGKEGVNNHQLISYTKKWLNQLIWIGDSGTLGERINLIAQLDKGLKDCRDKGCLQEVLSSFNPEFIKEISDLGLEGLQGLTLQIKE